MGEGTVGGDRVRANEERMAPRRHAVLPRRKMEAARPSDRAALYNVGSRLRQRSGAVDGSVEVELLPGDVVAGGFADGGEAVPAALREGGSDSFRDGGRDDAGEVEFGSGLDLGDEVLGDGGERHVARGGNLFEGAAAFEEAQGFARGTVGVLWRTRSGSAG